MTLLDKIDAIKEKYYSRSSNSESKTEPKADPAFQSSEYDAANRKYSSENFTPERRRKLAHAAPIYMKGIKKRVLIHSGLALKLNDHLHKLKQQTLI